MLEARYLATCGQSVRGSDTPATRRDSACASAGRNSVFDGMHAQ